MRVKAKDVIESSEYPLRGEGIEIRENAEEQGGDRRKYNIHVNEQLYGRIKEGILEELSEEKAAIRGASNKKGWVQQEHTKRWVLGYVATDEGYDAADADTDCTGQPGP